MPVLPNTYSYNFEIETLLEQFVAVIDNATIMRYDKVNGERLIKSVVKPTYVFGPKNRTMVDIINKAKNYTMPVVFCSFKSISANLERFAGKYNDIYAKNIGKGELLSYARPTPISIDISLSIVSSFQADIYQIYSKLCTQFQPEAYFSWYVPSTRNVEKVEELRNKIVWDLKLSMDTPDQIKEDQEQKFVGSMNFTLDGFIFPNPKDNRENMILDIGTTKPLLGELNSRIFRPLLSVNEKEDCNGSNRTEFASGRPRINFSYNVSTNKVYFIIEKERDFSWKFNNEINIHFNGYNFNTETKWLLVTDTEIPEKELVTLDFSDKLLARNRKNEIKSTQISGYLIDVKIINSNEAVLKTILPKNCKSFDIIVANAYDYDSLSDQVGCQLQIK